MTTSPKNNDLNEKLKLMKMHRPVLGPFLASALVLLIGIILITGQNLRQAEGVIERQIAEQGKRLILFSESMLTGDINLSAPFDLQSLVESLAAQEDMVFLAITDEEGRFIIHSDQSKVGKNFDIQSPDMATEQSNTSFIDQINQLLPNTDNGNTRWGLVQTGNSQLFLVHHPIIIPELPQRDFVTNRQAQAIATGKPSEQIEFFPPQIRHVFAAIVPTPLQKRLLNYRETTFATALRVVIVGAFLLWIFSICYRAFSYKRQIVHAQKTIALMHGEVRRLEDEVQRREKLIAIGNLAAGVAHEIRNPLSSIKGYATYFASLFPQNSENQKAAKVMVGEVERLNRVIGDLIGVSSPTDISIQEVSLKGVLSDITELLSQDAQSIGVNFITIGSDITVPMDPDRLKQAIINILLNALEAFKEDDYIKTMTDQPYITLKIHHDLNWYYIDISNNGPPVPQEVIPRIFDPYFTTKSQGTGLGLVNSYKIVEAHGGSLSVESLPDKDTHFTIRLPKNST